MESNKDEADKCLDIAERYDYQPYIILVDSSEWLVLS